LKAINRIETEKVEAHHALLTWDHLFPSTSFYFFIDLEEKKKKKKISSKRSLLLLLYHLKAAAAPFGLRWGLVGPASPIKGAAL
jgi:hypothetical protein